MHNVSRKTSQEQLYTNNEKNNNNIQAYTNDSVGDAICWVEGITHQNRIVNRLFPQRIQEIRVFIYFFFIVQFEMRVQEKKRREEEKMLNNLLI